MRLPLFLARRIYSKGETQKRVSRPAITIATLGVAIGLAVMIISVCVVLGFKHTVRDKVVGFGSHIEVASFTTLQSSNMTPIVVNDSLKNVLKKGPNVSHVQSFAMTQGIIKTENDFLGVAFKGVGEDFDSTFISDNLKTGVMPRFSSQKSGNNILISQYMANKLKLKAGDRVFAYFINGSGVRMRRFTVSGIYETNLSHYDNIMCFADIYTVQKLNGWQDNQVTGAEISINDFNKLNETAEYVLGKVNRTTDSYGETYSSKTIQELNPQIFSWLSLLDLNVWIILALMIAVAGVTMISGLLIIILERTNMIGVLKALGARNATIRKTFLWFAIFILTKGMLWGNVLGIGLMLLQKFTGIVKLDASTYYVSTVPIEINIPLIVAINVSTLIISSLVLVLPSYVIAKIHPAKSMRYE